MAIQNKKIPEGEFQALRAEVLTQWPTGRDVNLEESVAYHRRCRRTAFSPASW